MVRSPPRGPITSDRSSSSANTGDWFEPAEEFDVTHSTLTPLIQRAYGLGLAGRMEPWTREFEQDPRSAPLADEAAAASRSDYRRLSRSAVR